ncbi:MAG: SHOCT domain-containing protein [Synergistaceae bacterium]|nr:SHOCT domain-containing protein [Synergistaceae bacterium]
MKTLECPNCGAEYNPAQYKCEYCGSFIIMTEEKQFNVPEKIIHEMSESASTSPGIYVYGYLLGKGEIPLRLGLANYYTGKFMGVGGKLLLTKSNLYFTSHKVFQAKTDLKINLLDITSVNQELNLFVSQHISIHENGNSHRFVVYGGKEWINMINAAINDYTPSQGNNGNNSSDYTAELVKLKNLLDRGIITQEEFAIKKRMILGI